jgi:hypothetical protein
VLLSLHRTGDIYGMVDVILNFVETNLVGASYMEAEAMERDLDFPETALI